MPNTLRAEGEDVVTWVCRMFEGARFRFDILDDCTLTDAQKVEKARALISKFAAALLAARRENETLEQDAKRYRALRASFPVVEIQWTHDRFVLTTQEADGGFCTYQAATLQEFDEAMQEFEERAEYRAALAATPEGTTHTGENP